DSYLIERAEEAVRNLSVRSATGVIATADSFMDDPDRVTFVRGKFPTMIAAEMEAAAVAQVCYLYDKPFVVLRALSDIAGKNSSISFDQFLTTAAKNATKIIMEMI